MVGPILVRSGAIAGTESGDGLCEFGVVSCVGVEVDAGHGGLPGLLHRPDTGGRSAGMADDAAAAEIKKIRRGHGLPGGRSLPAPLAGADHRQGPVFRLEQGCRARGTSG